MDKSWSLSYLIMIFKLYGVISQSKRQSSCHIELKDECGVLRRHSIECYLFHKRRKETNNRKF